MNTRIISIATREIISCLPARQSVLPASEGLPALGGHRIVQDEDEFPVRGFRRGGFDSTRRTESAALSSDLPAAALA